MIEAWDVKQSKDLSVKVCSDPEGDAKEKSLAIAELAVWKRARIIRVPKREAICGVSQCSYWFILFPVNLSTAE